MGKFDEPQNYKPFVDDCTMYGEVRIGGIREVQIRTGLPATTSIERLEYLDDEKHIISMRIIDGDHKLKVLIIHLRVFFFSINHFYKICTRKFLLRSNLEVCA